MNVVHVFAFSTPRQLGGALRALALAGLLVVLLKEWIRRRRVRSRAAQALKGRSKPTPKQPEE